MEAFRFDNLVYIPFTKHASTSYTNLFRDQLAWTVTQTDYIDWDKDVVFAHILNPNTRHLKGITECLVKYNLFDLVDDDRFLKLLSTAVFDLHSYPLTVALGDDAYKIEWLMLDHPDYSADYITTKFLKAHGIDTSNLSIPKLYETPKNSSKKILLDKISKIRDDASLTGTLAYFYERDILLYARVWENNKYHKLENLPWHDCSWITNYKHKVSLT